MLISKEKSKKYYKVAFKLGLIRYLIGNLNANCSFILDLNQTVVTYHAQI